jgi:hypothetical protein
MRYPQRRMVQLSKPVQLALALGLVVLACPGPGSAERRIELNPIASARPGVYLWWRIEKGTVMDSGICQPGPNVAQENDILSRDGGLLRLYAARFPPASMQQSPAKLPEFKRGQRYYGALNPAAGLAIAEQHHAGEVWVFQLDDRLVVSKRGFSADKQAAIKVRCQPRKGKAKEWSLSSLPGFWLHVQCEGFAPFAIGDGVAGLSELQQDWLAGGGKLLKLPGNRGYVLVKDPMPGERWNCTVGGKAYSFASQRSFRDIADGETAGYMLTLPTDATAPLITDPLPPSDNPLLLPLPE